MVKRKNIFKDSWNSNYILIRANQELDQKPISTKILIILKMNAIAEK